MQRLSDVIWTSPDHQHQSQGFHFPEAMDFPDFLDQD